MAKHIVKKRLKKKSVEEEIRKANEIAAEDPIYKGRTKLQVRTGELILALLGALIGSFGTVSMMLPNGLTSGGITGLSKVFQKFLGIDYSVAYYILSAIIVLIVLVFLGMKEVRKIIILTVAFPTMMILIEQLHVEIIIPDMFLASVFTGAVFGVSNGLIFQAGYSSGGSDSVAKVIKVKSMPYKGLNSITTAINAAVVVLGAFVFGLNVGMYAIVTMYISGKVAEAVMYGFEEKLVQLEILTDCPEELKEYVMEEMGRGVSSLNVVGEYTGETKKQLRVICSPKESFLIKRFLAGVDSKAFVSVVQINSVWGIGRGFSNIKEDI